MAPPEVLQRNAREPVGQRTHVEVAQRECGEPVSRQESRFPHRVGGQSSIEPKHQHTRDRPTARGPEKPTVKPTLADVGAGYLLGKEGPGDIDVSRLPARLRGDDQGLWAQGYGVGCPVTVGRPHEAHRVRPRVAALLSGTAWIHPPSPVRQPETWPRRPLYIEGVDESRAQGYTLPG